MHTKYTNCIHSYVHVQKLNIIAIARRNIFYSKSPTHHPLTHLPWFYDRHTLEHPDSSHKAWLKIDDVKQKFCPVYEHHLGKSFPSTFDARFVCISKWPYILLRIRFCFHLNHKNFIVRFIPFLVSQAHSW